MNHLAFTISCSSRGQNTPLDDSASPSQAARAHPNGRDGTARRGLKAARPLNGRPSGPVFLHRVRALALGRSAERPYSRPFAHSPPRPFAPSPTRPFAPSPTRPLAHASPRLFSYSHIQKPPKHPFSSRFHLQNPRISYQTRETSTNNDYTKFARKMCAMCVNVDPRANEFAAMMRNRLKPGCRFAGRPLPSHSGCARR